MQLNLLLRYCSTCCWGEPYPALFVDAELPPAFDLPYRRWCRSAWRRHLPSKLPATPQYGSIARGVSRKH